MSHLRNPALLEPISDSALELQRANHLIDELNQKIVRLKEKNAQLVSDFLDDNERQLEQARVAIKNLCRAVQDHLNDKTVDYPALKTEIENLQGLAKAIGKQLDTLMEGQENDGALEKENAVLKNELAHARALLDSARAEEARQKQALEALKREHEALMNEELHALVQAALAELRRYRQALISEVPVALRPNLTELGRQLVDEEINPDHAVFSPCSYPEIEAIRKIGVINRLEAKLLTEKPVAERCRDVLEAYNSHNGKFKNILERNRDTWLTAIFKAIGVTLSLGTLWAPIYRVKGKLVTQTIQTLFHPNKLQTINDSVRLRQSWARSVASSQQNVCVR